MITACHRALLFLVSLLLVGTAQARLPDVADLPDLMDIAQLPDPQTDVTVSLEGVNARVDSAFMLNAGFSTQLIGPLFINGSAGFRPGIPDGFVDDMLWTMTNSSDTPPPPPTPGTVIHTHYLFSYALYPSLRVFNSERLTLDAFYGTRLLTLYTSRCVVNNSGGQDCTEQDGEQSGAVAGLTLGLRAPGSKVATTLTLSHYNSAPGTSNSGVFFSAGMRMPW